MTDIDGSEGGAERKAEEEDEGTAAKDGAGSETAAAAGLVPPVSDTNPEDGPAEDDAVTADDVPASVFDSIFDRAEIENELKQLRPKTLGEIDKFFAYYNAAALWKKRWVRLFRLVSITATALAGVLVVLSHQDVAGMFSQSAAVPPAPGAANSKAISAVANFLPLPGGWALLLGLIAGAALAVDKLSGISKSWMRYVLARQEIEAIRHRYSTELLIAEMSGKALFLITKCNEAMEEIDEVVLEETKQWVRDYREDLEQLQKAVSKFRPSERKPKS